MPVFSLFPSDEAADRALCLKVAAGLRGTGPAGALERWRTRPGELFSAPEAAALSESSAAAARLGLRTSVFDAAGLPPLPPPEPVIKAEVTGEGVRLYRRSVREFFPYRDIYVFAAGAVEETPPSMDPAELSAGLEAAIKRTLGETASPPAAPPIPRKETALYLDLLTAPGARYRLRWDEADYSWLGKTKEYSSMENFRLTLDELHAFSFGKIPVTAAFTALRLRAPLAPFRLRDLDAFDFNLRWFLAVTH
ncbi:MAG TPA: hypothetical protein PK523_03495 [Elusimicrobiales bacterium]|nr:hypothetical protein [Elusimicrobiales bacterium]